MKFGKVGQFGQKGRDKGYTPKGASKGFDSKGSEAKGPKGFDPKGAPKGYSQKGAAKGFDAKGAAKGFDAKGFDSKGAAKGAKSSSKGASKSAPKGFDSKGAFNQKGASKGFDPKGAAKGAWSFGNKRPLEAPVVARSAKWRRVDEALDAEIGRGPGKGIGFALTPIAGTWLKDGCEVEISKDGYVHWSGFGGDNAEEPAPIRGCGGGLWAMTFDGEEFFTCEIQAGGMRLSWIDGDVWERAWGGDPHKKEQASAVAPRIVPGKGNALKVAVPKLGSAATASGKSAMVAGLKFVPATRRGQGADDGNDSSSAAKLFAGVGAAQGKGVPKVALPYGKQEQNESEQSQAAEEQVQPWKIDEALASLDGPWHKTADDCTVTIYDGYVHWNQDTATGEDPPEPTRLEVLESGLFQMHFDEETGEVFTGQLKDGGQTLEWSDGEVWQRINDKTLEQGEVLMTF